jgi:SanA protein
MNRKAKIIAQSAGALMLALSIIPAVVFFKTKSAIHNTADHIPSKQFGIVLGAGLTQDHTPGAYLQQRLADAVLLYQSGKIKKILLTGDNQRHTYDEISAMNNYLLAEGIPQNVIYGDYAGFDTYSSVERASKIFGIKEAVFISQQFHLPRTLYIAEYKNMHAIGFCSKKSYGRKYNFIREWPATVKSFIDCHLNRKARFYGEKVNTNHASNIILEQL